MDKMSNLMGYYDVQYADNSCQGLFGFTGLYQLVENRGGSWIFFYYLREGLPFLLETRGGSSQNNSMKTADFQIKQFGEQLRFPVALFLCHPYISLDGLTQESSLYQTWSLLPSTGLQTALHVIIVFQYQPQPREWST